MVGLDALCVSSTNRIGERRALGLLDKIMQGNYDGQLVESSRRLHSMTFVEVSFWGNSRRNVNPRSSCLESFVEMFNVGSSAQL